MLLLFIQTKGTMKTIIIFLTTLSIGGGGRDRGYLSRHNWPGSLSWERWLTGRTMSEKGRCGELKRKAPNIARRHANGGDRL
jgi:hypothetical protein